MNTKNTARPLIAEQREAPNQEAVKLEIHQDFASYFDDLPVGINNVDILGNFTYVNKRFLEVSGFSNEDLIGKKGLKIGLFPADSLKILVKRMQERLKGSPAEDLELQFRCKDGRLIWVELTGKLLKKRGVPVGFQIASKEITNRKQAEKKLIETEEKYRALFDGAFDLVYVHDWEGNFLEANKAALDLLGYDQEDFKQLNFTSLVSKDEMARALASLEELKSTGIQRKPMEYRLKCKNGKYIDVDIMSSIIQFDGKPYAVQGLARDITEKKRAVEALRDSEKRYRVLFENMREGFSYCQMLFDAEPLDFIYLAINSSFKNQLGLKNVVGKKLSEVIPGLRESSPELLEKYARVAMTGIPDRFEFYVQQLDIWLDISVYSQEKGNFVAIFNNITERKREEEKLTNSEKRYRNLTQNIADMLMTIDLQGNITYLSRDMNDAGYAVAEILGKNIRSILTTESFEKALARIKQRANGATNLAPYEVEMIAKNGSIIPFELNTSSIVEGNQLRGIQVIGRNITERKQAEKEIRQNFQVESVISELLKMSEENRPLDELIERAIDQILSIGWLALEPKGSIFLVEDGHDQLVMKAHRGMDSQLLTACSRVPFGHCLCGRAALSGDIQFAASIDERHEISYENMPPHGHYCIPLVYSGKVLGVACLYLKQGYSPDVRQEKVLGIISDVMAGIIKRKNADERLRYNLERFDQVAESADEWIWEVDNRGVFQYCSPAATKILGYSADELVRQKHFYDLYPEEIRDTLRNVALSAFRQKQPLQGFVNPSTHKNGSVVILETNGLPILDKQGNIIGYRGVDKDITKQEQDKQELMQGYERLQNAMQNTVDAMAHMAETRDPYTAGHQMRVSKLAYAIGEGLGLSEERLSAIRIGASLHDVGKISIPAEILSKPGRLSEIEFNLLREHAHAGYEIVKNLGFPVLVADMVLHHHERLDGSGYPDVMRESEISLEAKILGVADVVEAMSSHRPYRPAPGIEKALEEISNNSGKLYEPIVVDVCLKLFHEKGFKFEG